MKEELMVRRALGLAAIALGAAAGDGTPRGRPFEIARTASMQSRPDVAAGAKSTAVAWADTGGAFVAELGESGISGETAIPSPATDPALAAAGDAFGLVWTAGAK